MAVNWNEVRRDFPLLKRFRYFLTASGGPMPRPVYEKAVVYYRELMEQGDSLWGENVERREKARRQVASFIGAKPEEVEFVTGLGVGMNLLAEVLGQRGSVLATTLEFPSTTLPWLHRRPGCVRWVHPDETGAVPVTRFRDAMSQQTGIIATSYVQYSNGFRQDLTELGNAKDDHLLVVNASQAAGAFGIDVLSMKIDALCSNSYKWLLSGYGCGILFVSSRLLGETSTPNVGWFSVQDRDALHNDRYQILDSAARFNVSSPPFPTVFALSAGIQYLESIGLASIEARVLELNRYLTRRLDEIHLKVLSPLEPEKYRSAATLVELKDPEATVRALQQQGILCTIKPEGMRVATHFFINEADIDVLIKALKGMIREGIA